MYNYLKRISFSAQATMPQGVIACIAGLLLLVSFSVFAKQAEVEANEQWSTWKAMDNGFVARRRQPPKVDLPKAERQLKYVQQRQRKLFRQHARLLEKLDRIEKSNLGSKKIQRQIAHMKKRIDKADQAFVKGKSNKSAKAKSANALWLYSSAEGLYSVSIPELASELGKREKNIRDKAYIGKLTLTNGGQAVAWHFDATNDRLIYVGEEYETIYTDENAYRFKAGGGKKQLQMAENTAPPTTAFGFATPFAESLTYEEEPDLLFSTWSVASEPDADYWFWDYLYGGYKDSIDVELIAPNPAAFGAAQLRVTLRGWTNIEVGDEHEVYAELNGQAIGSSVVWDGFEQAVLLIDFDQSLLNSSGSNALELKNSYTPGTHPGQWLDQIELDYQRLPVAENGRLWMHDVTAGVQTVSGFPSADIVLIESPDSGAVLRHDIRVDAEGSGFTVTFEASSNNDYLIVDNSAVGNPVVEVDEPSTLRKNTNMADYLIITPKDFIGTAQALASHRANQYSYVKVVLVEDIYDEFSAGREDPFAISRFMKRVANVWQYAPSMVALIGKGTLDHKDRMGYSDSFLPTVMTNTPFSLASSDDRLLGANGDAPFAFGRIPITIDAEGIAYVDKLIAYETVMPGDERFQAVLVADNPDKAGEFHDNSDALADYLTSSLGFSSVKKLYHPVDSVRDEFIQSSTWETGYVSYDGHGSTAQVGNGRENFIKASDAALLSNTAKPVFAALTCAAGDDTLPGTRSLAGALVLNPTGGAIASFAPTGLSLDYDAQIFGSALVDSLFISNNTLGDAVKEAKLLTQGQIRSYMQRMYSVVGDPAVYAR